MGLSKAQEAAVNKLRAAGGGELGIALDDPTMAYLVAVIAGDLGVLNQFQEFGKSVPPFFGSPLGELRIDTPFLPVYERLIGLRQDADTYFYCLGILHKARLKYQRILQAQPTPSVDQVGPRALLQYGDLGPAALAALLFWRKWIFDIDNRAGQETGYVFEPIVANAIGGVPFGAKKSPVKRGGSGTGRQVDCIRGTKAYEIKLRVTIAASGQGRWREELSFPEDCSASNYTPVLVVFDPTDNPKLQELQKAFLAAHGEVYVGTEAWRHLEQKAGATMAVFLEKYVRQPIQTLLDEAPEPDSLPEIRWLMETDRLEVTVLGETLVIKREPTGGDGDEEPLPEDVDEQIPGPG